MTTILGVQSIRLSQVEPESVTWGWRGYIPLGKVSVLDGDPDNGKSTVSLDLAARFTRGLPMPDGTVSDLQGACGVVLISAEDGLGDTIRPRLDAAGADTDLVTAITGTLADDGSEHGFLLPADLGWLQAEIEDNSARFVVIDPLMAFLGGDTNSFRDQDIRRALAPLARVAEDTGAAILIVRHLNKAQGGNPIYRGGGSIGIIGAARSGLLAAADPDDESRRVLAVTKSNLAEKPPALAYRLEPTENGSVRIRWEGPTDHRAGQLLAGPRDDEERTTRDDAKTLLRDALEHGPVPVKDLRNQWRDAGLSDASVRRAKTDLGIVAERVGGVAGDGRWQWRLPQIMQSKVPKVFTHTDEYLREGSDMNTNGFAHVDRETTKVLTPKPDNPTDDSEHLSEHPAETVRSLYDSGYFDDLEPIEIDGQSVVPLTFAKRALDDARQSGRVRIAGQSRCKKLLQAIETIGVASE